MKRTETIKDKDIFNNIIKKGLFHKNEYYCIYRMKKEEDKINYGVAISKKVGNAVTRNKLKGQTRAIIDNHRNLFKNKHNYIIMIRKSCANAPYDVLDKALIDLLESFR